MARSPLLALAVLAVVIAAAYAQGNPSYLVGTTKVEFMGKSPNFKVYPNSSADIYLAMKFSKLEERTAAGAKVNSHSITSLASADPVWTVTNFEAKKNNANEKVNITQITMTLDPATKQSFSLSCSSGGGSAGNAQSSNITFKVIMFVGITEDVEFPYGWSGSTNDTQQYVDVAKGGLKFNIEHTNWPFCATDNYLNLDIDVSVKGTDAVAPTTSGNTLTVNLGGGSATLTFPTVAYANATTSSKVDGVTATITTGTSGASGTPTTINLKMPKPTGTSFYYDPTVTVVATGGSASAVRVSFWAAAAALLLSMFMRL